MSAAFAGVNTVQLKRPANTYFSLVPTASMANDSNNYTVCVCSTSARWVQRGSSRVAVLSSQWISEQGTEQWRTRLAMSTAENTNWLSNNHGSICSGESLLAQSNYRYCLRHFHFHCHFQHSLLWLFMRKSFLLAVVISFPEWHHSSAQWLVQVSCDKFGNARTFTQSEAPQMSPEWSDIILYILSFLTSNYSERQQKGHH